MATAVTLAAALIAFPIAYYAARYARGRWKAFFYLAVMLPLWSSYLVRVYAWKLILAKEGIITWLADKLHLTWLLDAILAMPVIGGPSLCISYIGTFLVFLYVWLPYMILPTQAALERVPGNLIEASADLGATPGQTFSHGDLPAGAARPHCRVDLHLLADARRLHHPADRRHLELLPRPGRLCAAGHCRQHPARRRLHRRADRDHGHLSDDRQADGGLRCALTARREPRGLGLVAAAIAGLLFLHVPLRSSSSMPSPPKRRAISFPPPGYTPQWFAVVWERQDIWNALGCR